MDLAWVGFEISLKGSKLGLSVARSQWLVKWLSETADTGRVRVADMSAVLGRLSFGLTALGHLRPFLGPVYAWTAAMTGKVIFGQLPKAIILIFRLGPGQPAETPLHLNLPTEGRPLTEILLDNFDPYVDGIFNAVPGLDSFTTWFTENYDTALHAEFHAVFMDSMLLFRSAENILRMKRRFRALSPQEPLHDPIAVDEPAQAALPTADVPAADEPAATNPASAPSSTGTTLEFY